MAWTTPVPTNNFTFFFEGVAGRTNTERSNYQWEQENCRLGVICI